MIDYTNKNFTDLDLGEHAEDAFISYSKYVVQDRALPDVRDGLKPVHRRILFAQQELNNTFNKPFKKSARIIGDVLGKYHPHGDSACYQSLVRMAQPWVMSAPLSSGQGNWGDTDKNPFAAMRYTEVRMSRIANGMMSDLRLDTVDWNNNYDGSEQEPSVLPTRFPNLVINGVEGIAIGMASSLPPHNPIEAMGCVIALTEGRLSNEPVTTEQLMEIMPAPDFPTGGTVHSLENFSTIWESGRGSVRIRAEWEEEIIEGRKCIVIKALPYGIAPSSALIQVEQSRKPDPTHGRIELHGVVGELDESTSEDGLRLVFEVSYGVNPELIFNELCNLPNSCFDTSISYNLNVIKDKKPEPMGLREALDCFIDFREEVITKRTIKLLKDSKSRMHTLEALMKALNNIDETIATIRKNPRNIEAKLALMDLLDIDEVQAGKILDITLSKLTQGEIANYESEYNQCESDILGFEKILEDKDTLLNIILDETNEQIDIFLTDKDDNGLKLYDVRRSQWTHERIKLSKEDIIPKENCAVLISEQGYVRRVSSSDLKEQQKGGQGTQQIELAKKDSLIISTECFSHDTLAFVTSLGRVAFTRAFELDTGIRGQHINNIIKLDAESDEKVIKVQAISMDVVNNAQDKQLMLVTKHGLIKRTNFELFNPNRQRTVKAITLIEGDSVVNFEICSASDIVTIITSSNRVTRYSLEQVRETSRNSRGIRAIKLEDGASVIACSVVSPDDVEDTVLGMVSDTGLLKLCKLDSCPLVSRGCLGVKGMKLDDGVSILNAFSIKESELEATEIVSITKKGKMNRVSASLFTIRSRITMGSRLSRTQDEDELVSAYPIKAPEKTDEEEMSE